MDKQKKKVRMQMVVGMLLAYVMMWIGPYALSFILPCSSEWYVFPCVITLALLIAIPAIYGLNKWTNIT